MKTNLNKFLQGKDADVVVDSLNVFYSEEIQLYITWANNNNQSFWLGVLYEKLTNTDDYEKFNENALNLVADYIYWVLAYKYEYDDIPRYLLP